MKLAIWSPLGKGPLETTVWACFFLFSFHSLTCGSDATVSAISKSGTEYLEKHRHTREWQKEEELKAERRCRQKRNRVWGGGGSGGCNG